MKSYYKILTHMASGIFCLLGVLIWMSFFSPLNNSTTDDAKQLPNILESINRRSVLGANTENSDYLYGCTQEKPVVGWIDYAGAKVVKENLPAGEMATACFQSLEEANQNGFELAE